APPPGSRLRRLGGRSAPPRAPSPGRAARRRAAPGPAGAGCSPTTCASPNNRGVAGSVVNLGRLSGMGRHSLPEDDEAAAGTELAAPELDLDDAPQGRHSWRPGAE